MADSSASSEPAANSAATRGFEAFFPLAAFAALRRCLVAAGNCVFSTEYTGKMVTESLFPETLKKVLEYYSIM